MNHLLLDHFNGECKSYSYSDKEDEDCNISDELLCEGTSANSVQYSNCIAKNMLNNSCTKQRQEIIKLNSYSVKNQLFENFDCQSSQYMSYDKFSLLKPKSLKQEIRMLLKMLATKNDKATSYQSASNLNKVCKIKSIDHFQDELITMRDVESGF